MSVSEARLPRPPGALRRWLAEHPQAVDIFILVCYLLGTLPLLAVDIVSIYSKFPSDFAIPTVYSIVAFSRVGVGIAALVFRRTAPVAGLVGLTLANIIDVGSITLGTGIAQLFLLYAVPVYVSVRAGWISWGVVILGTVGAWLTMPLLGGIAEAVETPFGSTVVVGAVVSLIVLLVGINLGNRRRYLEAIIDRANQLARERDQLAQLAVAEERSRIAREIHDIVAHSVSVMIALSEGGARVIEAAPEEAANAMRRSAETGRTALAEMRRLLGALQSSDAAELAPQPGIDDIPELIRGFEEAGLRVTLSGAAHVRDDRLQELAIYRVVQEGLTNVLRYAGEGAIVEVGLQTMPGGIEVSVRDFGRVPGTSGPQTGLGSGRGLAGLAERVRVFGGKIESGPVVPGWMLRVFFPTNARGRN